MAQPKLAEVIVQVRNADTLLVGAHAVSMDEAMTPDVRLYRVRGMLVDASLGLDAVVSALRHELEAEA